MPPLTPERGWRRPLAMFAAAALGISLTAASVPVAQAAGTASFCTQVGQELDYATVATVEGFAAGTAVHGLSVTSGTTPDAFTGTYVGFIANALGKGKDLLLFKLSSPVIDGTSPNGLEAAGIWEGMSGSPVYTQDGALIGAVAYSLNSDNLPIAGVTPAEYMKAIGTTAVGTSSKVHVDVSNLRVSPDGVKTAGTSLAGSTFTPVRAVKVAGGAGAEENAFINRTFARTPRTARSATFMRSGGFMAAAAEVPAAVPAALEAGGTIAVLYADQDLIAGAVGTVTAVCGSTVWAFGHPMDYTGNVSLPMSNASTAMIVPDSTGRGGSYKQVSEFGAPVGMITQDRNVGIRGTIAATDPDSFPIRLDVKDPGGTLVATYQTTLADPELADSAVAALVGTGAQEQLDQYGAGTGQLTWTISFTRADSTPGSLTNSEAVASADFPDEVGTQFADDVYSIETNSFEEVAITGITATLELKSADAISYKASGVQVQTGPATWASLSGAKLKSGSTNTVRAVYTVIKNGKPHATGYGDPTTLALALKSTAKTGGAFKVAAAATPDESCDVDPSGDIACSDWTDSSDDYTSFDDLLAGLQGEPSYNVMLGGVKYSLKKGSASAKFTWTAPGVVTGSAKASFKITP